MSGRDSNDPVGSQQSAEEMRIPEGVSLGQFSQHPSWHAQVNPDGEDVPAPGPATSADDRASATPDSSRGPRPRDSVTTRPASMHRSDRRS